MCAESSVPGVPAAGFRQGKVTQRKPTEAESIRKTGDRRNRQMIELIRTNDPVTLSFAVDTLRQAGIEPLVLDTHMSVVEGSIGVIPRRIAVVDEDAPRARMLLREAGLAGEMAGDSGA